MNNMILSKEGNNAGISTPMQIKRKIDRKTDLDLDIAPVHHKTHVLYCVYCETCGKLIDKNQGLTSNQVAAIIMAHIHEGEINQ